MKTLIYLKLVSQLEVFGSSQLTDHKYLKPKSIHDKEMLEEFSKDFMYFEYINFINSVGILPSCFF